MAHDHPNIAVALVLLIYLGLCVVTSGSLRMFVMSVGALLAGGLILTISVSNGLDFK
ncbi:MAG: hypothetical protein JWM31_1510 [Solirubrobacterales bacterium]|nr:hypothetical protein [Solirubrobacterales bacterium]